jgi:hypothetical protein
MSIDTWSIDRVARKVIDRSWIGGCSLSGLFALYLDNLATSGKFVVESYTFSSAANLNDKS